MSDLGSMSHRLLHLPPVYQDSILLNYLIFLCFQTLAHQCLDVVASQCSSGLVICPSLWTSAGGTASSSQGCDSRCLVAYSWAGSVPPWFLEACGGSSCCQASSSLGRFCPSLYKELHVVAGSSSCHLEFVLKFLVWHISSIRLRHVEYTSCAVGVQ